MYGRQCKNVYPDCNYLYQTYRTKTSVMIGSYIFSGIVAIGQSLKGEGRLGTFVVESFSAKMRYFELFS